MKKLKLEIEALEVQSFDTGDRDARSGTVRAHQQSKRCGYSEEECNTTDEHWKTCGVSCVLMCMGSRAVDECIV